MGFDQESVFGTNGCNAVLSMVVISCSQAIGLVLT